MISEMIRTMYLARSLGSFKVLYASLIVLEFSAEMSLSALLC